MKLYAKSVNALKEVVRSNFITRSIFRVYSICLDSNLSVIEYLKAKKRNYVFMVPSHNNVGDIAQTVCISEWLAENYPGYTTMNIVQSAPLDEKILHEICKGVRAEDNVFVHSGFNMTDVGHETDVPIAVYESHKVILNELKKHKIVFLPQTVQYKDINKWEPMKRLYESHKNLVFLSRDTISMEYAKRLIPSARHFCCPDVVTMWIGKYRFENEPKGVLACMRFGEESLLSEEKRKEVLRRLGEFATVERTDTNFCMKSHKMRKNRKRVVVEMIQYFSRYKVIVTDRYHGVIFSLIANRPVVVLPTFGHKVISGLGWFPEHIKQKIYFVSEVGAVDKICNAVKQAYDSTVYNETGSYFKEHFFDLLKDKISD